jgi:tRNA(Ile)-lysidine synthase
MIDADSLRRIHLLAPTRLVVGLSGGMDSVSLLHAVVAVSSLPVHAIHVNHGLHVESDRWQAHCEALCRALGVGITTVHVRVSRQGSIEENARDARYQAFAERLSGGDLLLLAHHADDQVETVLLGLLRGSGKPGVTGMPTERSLGKARLYRPLLGRSREDIGAYARLHQLHWVNDDSNQATHFNRNYLRHEVLPVIRARWPDAGERLLDAVQRDLEVSGLIDAMATTDQAGLRGPRGGLLAHGLAGLDASRRRNVLRYLIRSLGLPLPPAAILGASLDAFLAAAEDAAPLLSWQETCIRRFRGEVFLTAKLPDVDSSAVLMPTEALSFGSLSADVVKGRGMAMSFVQDVRVRFRRGGEGMRMRNLRSLKNLFQETGVPPWLREHIPLLYRGDELIAVAGLPDWDVPMLVCGSAITSPGSPGVEFLFRMPNQPYSLDSH